MYSQWVYFVLYKAKPTPGGARTFVSEYVHSITVSLLEFLLTYVVYVRIVSICTYTLVNYVDYSEKFSERDPSLS